MCSPEIVGLMAEAKNPGLRDNPAVASALDNMYASSGTPLVSQFSQRLQEVRSGGAKPGPTTRAAPAATPAQPAAASSAGLSPLGSLLGGAAAQLPGYSQPVSSGSYGKVVQ